MCSSSAALLRFKCRLVSGCAVCITQARRVFREAVGFDVRYWTLPELRRLFTRCVGDTRFEVDCYFGIGLQQSDKWLMTPKLRLIVRGSECLKAASRHVPALVSLADSVFAKCVKARDVPEDGGWLSSRIDSNNLHVS